MLNVFLCTSCDHAELNLLISTVISLLSICDSLCLVISFLCELILYKLCNKTKNIGRMVIIRIIVLIDDVIRDNDEKKVI